MNTEPFNREYTDHVRGPDLRSQDFVDSILHQEHGRDLQALEQLTSDHDNSLPFREVIGARKVAALLEHSRLSAEPVNLLVFWGPHPTHQEPGRADKRTIDMLGVLLSEFQVDSHLTVLTADSHGVFNGIINPAYLGAIKDSFSAKLGSSRAKVVNLSSVYEEYGLNLDLTPELAQSLTNNNPDLLESLQRGARNRNIDTIKALEYAEMRLQEKELIRNLVGENGIFVVIGDPASRDLFPGEDAILFTRAREKSGARYTNRAPWIPRS